MTRKEIGLTIRPRQAVFNISEDVHDCRHCHYQFIVYGKMPLMNKEDEQTPFKSVDGVVVCPYCGWREGTEHEHVEHRAQPLMGASAEQAITTINAFLADVRKKDCERGKENSLVYIADLRQRFTDAQIATWMNAQDYRDGVWQWDCDGLSSSQSSDIAFMLGHVNTLISTPRHDMVHYLYYRWHSKDRDAK